MTNETLTHQRNVFLATFFGIIIFNIGCLLLAAFIMPELTTWGPTITVFMKVTLIYAVFRLSRFLKQPYWLTIIYCILISAEIVYLIPLIGLLIAVKKTRKAIPYNYNRKEN